MLVKCPMNRVSNLADQWEHWTPDVPDDACLETSIPLLAVELDQNDLRPRYASARVFHKCVSEVVYGRVAVFKKLISRGRTVGTSRPCQSTLHLAHHLTRRSHVERPRGREHNSMVHGYDMRAFPTKRQSYPGERVPAVSVVVLTWPNCCARGSR